MTSRPPAGSHKFFIEAHERDITQLDGRGVHVQKGFQDSVVPVKDVQYPQADRFPVVRAPVVITVLAGDAAEFLVQPPIGDGIAAFQTNGFHRE